MGIQNLYKFITKYAPEAIQPLQELNNKKIAFDTSIFLYQFISAVHSKGNILLDENDCNITHIHGIISRVKSFLKKGIHPVLVFDGRPPSIKTNTLDKRNKKRIDACNKLKNDDLTTEDKCKYMQQSVTITQSQMNECIDVAALFGIPVIDAIEEADSQCAYLSKNNLVDYVASEDMDMLPFGTKILVRNIGKKTQVQISLDVILTKLNITHEQFVEICILLGCDYCPTIPGVGPAKVYPFIKKYGSIAAMITSGKFPISEEFINLYQQAKEYFLNPPVKTNLESKLIWTEPNTKQINLLLKTKFKIKKTDEFID